MFGKGLVQSLILLSTLLCGQILCGYSGGGGSSKSNSKQDSYGNYAFNYEITDPWGAQNYRTEKGNGKEMQVEGSYGLTDVDGRMRVVDYWADKHNGFRAKIKSNEPGVGDQDSADAIYNGPDSKGSDKSQQTINHGSGSGSGFGGGGGGGKFKTYFESSGSPKW